MRVGITLGFAEAMRKNLVSEPAPREMICFGVSGEEDRKLLTSLSIAVVRMYVPRVNNSIRFRWREELSSIPLTSVY